MLDDHTAGDPMRLEVRWTNLSRRQIARRITELGTPIGRDVASQLLRKHRYRRRKASKSRTMGGTISLTAFAGGCPWTISVGTCAIVGVIP